MCAHRQVLKGKLELPGGTLIYDWEKKRVKNLNLRLRPDGTAAVSTPQRFTQAQVEAFLREKAPWIARAQARAQARMPVISRDAVFVQGNRLPIQTVSGGRDDARLEPGALVVTLRDPPDEERRRQLTRRALEQAGASAIEDSLRRMFTLVEPLGVPFPVMTTRWARTRWGSCTRFRGRISINRAVFGLPPACMDYVLLHELVHFLHPDHSQAFYARLASLMPDYTQREALLRRFTPWE